MVTKPKIALQQYIEENPSSNILKVAVLNHHHHELEAMLTSPLFNVRRLIPQAFVTAINTNNIVAIRMLLKHGNITSIQKGVILKFAARRFRLGLVRAILDVNHHYPLSRSDSITALELAMLANSQAIFSILFDFCREFISSESKMFFLRSCIQTGKFQILHELIEQESIHLVYCALLSLPQAEAEILITQLPWLTLNNKQLLLLQAIRFASTYVVSIALPLAVITPDLIREMLNIWKQIPHPNQIGDLILPYANDLLTDDEKDDILQTLPKTAIVAWVQHLGLGIGGEALAHALIDADEEIVFRVLRLCVDLNYRHLILPLFSYRTIPGEEFALIQQWALNHEYDILSETSYSPTFLHAYEQTQQINAFIPVPESPGAQMRHRP